MTDHKAEAGKVFDSHMGAGGTVGGALSVANEYLRHSGSEHRLKASALMAQGPTGADFVVEFLGNKIRNGCPYSSRLLGILTSLTVSACTGDKSSVQALELMDLAFEAGQASASPVATLN